MTENEALKSIIEDGIELGAGDYVELEALKVAAKALEEIQKYKEIGTVEEIEPYIRLGEKLSLCDLVRENARLAKEIRFLEGYEKQLEEYKKIGTVEECREAREKQRAKKSTNKRYEEEDFEYVGGCPCCGNIVGEEWTYCFKCGQKLDWSKP